MYVKRQFFIHKRCDVCSCVITSFCPIGRFFTHDNNNEWTTTILKKMSKNKTVSLHLIWIYAAQSMLFSMYVCLCECVFVSVAMFYSMNLKFVQINKNNIIIIQIGRTDNIIKYDFELWSLLRSILFFLHAKFSRLKMRWPNAKPKTTTMWNATAAANHYMYVMYI